MILKDITNNTLPCVKCLHEPLCRHKEEAVFKNDLIQKAMIKDDKGVFIEKDIFNAKLSCKFYKTMYNNEFPMPRGSKEDQHAITNAGLPLI